MICEVQAIRVNSYASTANLCRGEGCWLLLGNFAGLDDLTVWIRKLFREKAFRQTWDVLSDLRTHLQPIKPY